MRKLRRLPPLNAVKAFDAAVRYGGFTAAGEELHVCAGAVSRQISNLEDYFGVDLFTRRNNAIDITEAGERYFTRIRPALDLIEDASRLMVRRSRGHEIHVAVNATFAARWLIPRLSGFEKAFPGIDIQISATASHFLDSGFDENGPDIAIDNSLNDVSSEYCDPLFDIDLQAVCHPKFLAGPVALSEPQDLAQHTLLYNVNRLTLWRQWFAAAGVDVDLVGRSVKFANSAMVVQAALEGVGIACAETAFVCDDLASGRLISPFGARLKLGCKYFMSINPARAHEKPAIAFRGWLLDEFNRRPVEGLRLVSNM